MALTKAINLRLKEVQRKEEVFKKPKIEIIAAKDSKNREEINLSSQKDKDDSDRFDTNLD